MNSEQKDILIIPDVHGRLFWKAAFEKYELLLKEHKMQCVFLGDYVDPYDREIDAGEAYGYKQTVDNFAEIIEKKKQYGRSVTLLLGNHDLQYVDEYSEGEACKCRYMWGQSKRIKSLLNDNWKLFSLGYETVLDDGRRCLFTHAGVVKAWVDVRFDNMAESDITAAWLDSFLVDKSKLYIMADVGEDRGGRGYGSPVWADVEEFYWGWQNEKARKHSPEIRQTMYTGIYQVFGHTLYNIYGSGSDDYVINEHFAMLDARRAFVMHSDGKIETV